MSFAVGAVAVAVVIQAGIIMDAGRKGFQVTGHGDILSHNAIKVEGYVHNVLCTGAGKGGVMRTLHDVKGGGSSETINQSGCRLCE